MPAQTVIKLRRDTAANWGTVDPTLAAGEAGFESDTGKLKIGDGTTAWTGLGYVSGGASVEVGDTAPATPEANMLWWESDTGTLFIYYDGYWVEAVAGVVGPVGPQGQQGEAGVVVSATAPSDTTVLWLDTTEVGDAVLPVGGTTGQVLVKSTNSDYDTEWSSNHAISPNYIINGAFDIWQRGTSFSSGARTYTADRWTVGRSGNVGGMLTTQSTDTPANFQYSIKVARTASETETADSFLCHNMELAGLDLASKTVTASFWAKAGANFSGELVFRFRTSSTNASSLLYNSGGLFSASNSNYNQASSNNFTPSTDWQKYSYTFTVDSNAVTAQLSIGSDPSGTAGADDSFYITGVQLEAGSVATPFRRNANSIQGELAACQRYYYRTPTTTQNYRVFSNLYGNSTVQARGYYQLPVTMRAAPSFSSSGSFQTNGEGGQIAATSVALARQTPDAGELEVNVASGLIVGSGYVLRGANDATAYIDFSAEL